MLIQVTAYPVFGQLSLLVQAHESTPTGRSYTRLIQECAPLHESLSEGEPWDLVWAIHYQIGQALERRDYGPSAPF